MKLLTRVVGPIATNLYVLGDEPSGEAIAIEDSPNGIIAAKRAGLRCVVVPNPITAGLDLSEADLQLKSLADVTLPQLIERLGSAQQP